MQRAGTKNNDTVVYGRSDGDRRDRVVATTVGRRAPLSGRRVEQRRLASGSARRRGDRGVVSGVAYER
jgi:hypothetical protein